MDKRTIVLLSMTLANAMTLVDQTAVPLALPNIMHDFGVATGSAQWVLTASLLPLAGLLVLGGRLGICSAAAGSSSSAVPSSPVPPRWAAWPRPSKSCCCAGCCRGSVAR